MCNVSENKTHFTGQSLHLPHHLLAPPRLMQHPSLEARRPCAVYRDLVPQWARSEYLTINKYIQILLWSNLILLYLKNIKYLSLRCSLLLGAFGSASPSFRYWCLFIIGWFCRFFRFGWCRLSPPLFSVCFSLLETNVICEKKLGQQKQN